MKKLFTLFMALFISVFAANAVKFTVNVSIADALYLQYYDSNYNMVKVDLAQGDNPIDTNSEYGASIRLMVNDGYAITGLTKNGTAQNLSSITYYETYVSSIYDADAVYAVEVKPIAEAYDAKIGLTIDDPSRVRAMFGSREITLSSDDAGKEIEVSYISTVEKTLTISAITNGDMFYKVTLNGEKVANSSSYTSNYYVTVSDGAKVNVQTEYPDVNAKVSFVLSEGAEDFYTSATVNGEAVENFINGFEAKLGSKIKITSDNYTNYKIESVSVDGSVINYFYGTHEFTLNDDVVISVTAHLYGTLKGTIIVDNPANVSVYNGSEYGTLLTLQAGENTVEVGEKETRITVKANSGAYITSILQGDVEKFTTGSSSITMTLAEGDVITIKTGTIERNAKAILYIDDLSAASWGKSVSRGDRSTLSVVTGYNVIAFDPNSDSDRLLNCGVYGSPIFKAYLNDQEIELPYSNATYFNSLSLSDGDIVKVYIKAEPTTYNVSFDLGSAAADQVTVTKDILTSVTDLTAGFTAFNGTQVDIKAVDGVNVAVNGEALTAVDGTYTFTVAADSKVTFSSGVDGINAIGVDADAVKSVYNLQGIRVNSELNNLPAGIYIVNGKKVVVK